MLLAEQVDRDRQRRPLDRHAVEVVQRRVDRQRHQPPPRGVHQPHLDDHRALGRLAARLGPVQVGPGRQRHVVARPRRLGDVVDELAAGVLEHDRPPDRLRELGEDLGHPAPLQDQVGEALVDLLAAAQQLELVVQHGGVDRLGDLDEAHGAPEGHERHAGLGARLDHRRRDVLAPGRAELDRDRRGALPEHRVDPRPLALGARAGAEPGREHELAALEQVVGVGHLDHVRPAQLAIEQAVARHDLREATAYDRQLQDLGEREHTNRHALSPKTRRCVHCDAERQRGGSRWPDWRGPAGGTD